MLLVLLILIGIPLILLNTSYFQQRLVDRVTKDLNQKTGAKIYIEDSEISLFRGIVFHHVQINDSLGRQILKAERFDAEVRVLPLLSRRLELNALRLIRADIHLWRDNPKGKLNIQSIIDAFKKPNKKTILPWHLDFSTILLRNSRIRYDVKSEFNKTDGIDGNHLDFSRVSAKMSLKIAPKRHYQLRIYKFQAEEKCGLKIDDLKCQAKLSDNAFTLKNLKIYSAKSSMEIDLLDAKYHGFSAFSNFANAVKFNQTNIRLTVVPFDFSFLNASLANLNKPVKLSLSAIGKLSELTCNQILVNMDNIFLLNGKITLKGLPKIKDLYMNGLIETLRIMPECLEYFSGVATNQFAEIPALRNLGTINYMGNINTVAHRWVLRGDFATAAGNVGTDIQLSPQNDHFLFKGKINTDAFKLNRIFPDNKMLGDVAFDVTVDGAIDSQKGSSGKIDGLIPSVFYNGYKYQNLTLNGQFDKMGMEGICKINDENARLVFFGSINRSNPLPKYKFDILVDEINLQPLNILSKAGKSNAAFHLHSDFEGKTLDDLQGSISIDSLSLFHNQEWFHLNHLDLTAGRDPARNHILITSPLINGEIWGDYKFSTLMNSARSLVGYYLPSLINPGIPDFSNNNVFDFHCTLSPSEHFSKVFGLPFTIEKTLDVRGFYNDRLRKFRLKAEVPELTYGKTLIQSMGLLFENPQQDVKFLAYAQIGSGDKQMKFDLDTRSSNDNTALKINISNAAVKTYSGNIQSDLRFSKRADGKIQVGADLNKSDIIVNDSVWQIHPTKVQWEGHRLYVEDFQLTHSGQFIKIQGFASENSSDTLSVQMNSFSLDDLFMILPKTKSNLSLGGLVSGHAKCMRLLDNPAMNADLTVRDFSINHTVLGNLTAKSKWNNALKALALDGVIRSNEEIGGVHKKMATASGAYFPTSDSLFLSIIGDRVPLGFLDPYLGKIMYQMEGVASGNIHLIGPMKNLGIYAQAYVENASFGVEMLNTRYYFSDSVLLSPRIVVFRNVDVRDKEGNHAKATGIIRHDHFKNMQTSIDIQTNKLLAMDIPPSSNAYFYGTAYGSGSVSINGRQEKMTIDVNMRTEDKTNATISFLDNSEVAEYSFINFIQKKKVNEDYNLEFKKGKSVKPDLSTKKALTDLTVNLQIEATPKAELTLITDPSSGDEIKARGNGAIRAVFRGADDIQLFGRYTIENGSYKFIYENLLRRDFTIENGGSINFSGNPFAAELNIVANYTVNANLSDLLSSSDISSSKLSSNSIPVNCVLKLNGELQKPGIQLGLDYPAADEDLKRRIANVINTDDMMNQQIVFLMLFGRFSTPTYNSAQSGNTSGMSTVLNTTISTLSSQLNSMISDVFGQSKMSFDFDYRNEAYEMGAPGEWKVGMSGKWLDNRLTFNGNLGSREDLTQTGKSQFIGEFDIDLKLNNSEKWSAKFFNRANDNRYFKSALNTQGAGIVYKEDFNTFSDLFAQMVEMLQKPFKKGESK